MGAQEGYHLLAHGLPVATSRLPLPRGHRKKSSRIKEIMSSNKIAVATVAVVGNSVPEVSAIRALGKKREGAATTVLGEDNETQLLQMNMLRKAYTHYFQTEQEKANATFEEMDAKIK